MPGLRLLKGSRRGLLRSSSFRFTLLYAAFFGGSVLVLFAVVAWSLTRYAERELDTTVTNEIAEVETAAQPGAGLPRRTLGQVIDGMAKGSPGTFYLLQSPQGLRVAGNLPPMPPRYGPRNLPGWGGVGTRIRGAGIGGAGIRGPASLCPMAATCSWG